METMAESEDLVAAMIAGVCNDPPWQDFVGRLREAFHASHANIIFRRSDLAQAFMTQASSPDVEQFGDLRARHVPADDPISYYEMKPFKCYEIGEFLADTDLDEHPFIKEFLGPLGMGQLLICRVTGPDEMQAWISITRGSQQFSSDEKARIERLSRLFGEALGIFGKLKTAEDQRNAYARAMRARATGIIQLDQTGVILHADEPARACLDRGSVLSATGDRLRTAASGDRAKFEAALSRVLGEESEEEFLALGNEDQALELLICRAAEPFEPAWTHGPRAIVYLAMVGGEKAPDLKRLMKLFGLTPREAALAQLLHQGGTLSSAAADLGLSEQTVRAYLRQVFQKAGVTRQADLVRRIQGSLAGIT